MTALCTRSYKKQKKPNTWYVYKPFKTKLSLTSSAVIAARSDAIHKKEPNITANKTASYQALF